MLLVCAFFQDEATFPNGRSVAPFRSAYSARVLLHIHLGVHMPQIMLIMIIEHNKMKNKKEN